MEKEVEGKKDKNYLNKRLKNFNKMLEYTELKTCYREYFLNQAVQLLRFAVFLRSPSTP